MRFQGQIDLKLAFLYADAYATAYDDDPVSDTDELESDPDSDPGLQTTTVVKPVVKPKAKPNITPEVQEYLNSILAEDRRKHKSASDKVITQLETLKNQVGTTGAEKEQLEARIEDLKNSQLTADEMRKKEEKKREHKHKTELDTAQIEASKWKTMFQTSTITRAITDAAVVNDAHNPRHIVNELAPNTRLVEELDEENKPTGMLVPRVKITTVKDGKPTTLEFGVTEAVKFMKEQEEHAPLFKSGATGGLGGSPSNSKKRGINSDTPPEDPAEYREWRKKNPDKVGGLSGSRTRS